MPAAAMRPYLTAGVTLAGASLIAVTSVTPATSLPAPHVANLDVQLTSGGFEFSDLLNIPYNLFADLINIPYQLFEAPYTVASNLPDGTPTPHDGLIPNTADPDAGQFVPGSTLAENGVIDQPSVVWPEYYGSFDGTYPDPDTGGSEDYVFNGALNFLSAALDYTGSFYVSNPTNVFGWDTANPWNLSAAIDVLLPFGDLGPKVAHNVNIIAEAEFPEADQANAYFFHDLIGELQSLFQVPLSDLTDGYTLPEDGAHNPVGAGADALGRDGLEFDDIWSNQHVTLDPDLGFGDYLEHLLDEPAENPIHLVDPSTILPTIAHAIQAVNLAFNPFQPDEASFIFQAADELYGIPAIINGIWTGEHGLMPDAPPIIPESVVEDLGGLLNSIIGPDSALAQFLINVTQPFDEFVQALSDYPTYPPLNTPLPDDVNIPPESLDPPPLEVVTTDTSDPSTMAADVFDTIDPSDLF